MAELHVSCERRMDVSAGQAYTCIADFKNHHPNFLPPAFSDFRVDEGGYGAGTVHRVTVSMGGRTRHLRMRVDEPDPGRTLTESEIDAPLVTTFTVEPEDRGCLVRIETRWESARGLPGLLERWFAPLWMKKLYREELNRLATYAKSVAPNR